MNRCTGCIWRTPQEFGGQGIICRPNENGEKCPEWVIRNTLNVIWKHKKPANWMDSEVQLEAHIL
jgi:hypothetical protein